MCLPFCVVLLPRTSFTYLTINGLYVPLCSLSGREEVRDDLKFDLQLLSQCGSTSNCLSRSVPEIRSRGVTVSMSAFLACHPMLLRGFESRLGLESSGCSMWHFLKLVARGFLRVLRFPPLLHRFNSSAQINAISTLSN